MSLASLTQLVEPEPPPPSIFLLALCHLSQRTGDVLAVYRALLECRSQAEGAAYTPGPDEEACARLANVAIVKVRVFCALPLHWPFASHPPRWLPR